MTLYHRSITVIAMTVCSLALSAQSAYELYWNYISQWRDVVLEQEDIYHIPASITMAQALLESGAGQSELTREGNNHFGIKCGSAWMGESYYQDDDAKGECFRVYADASESFRDHSIFLQKPRYKSLYDLDIDDYKGWAVRIRECGYATDPNYSNKLIRLIEDYGLDTLRSKDWHVPSIEAFKRLQRERAEAAKSTQQLQATPPASVQETLSEEEASEPVAEGSDRSAIEERRAFWNSHTRMWARAVPYFVAHEGDTYANVAFRLNMRERTIRVWNDALGLDLHKGERVYLGRKHKYGERDKAELWVHPGESLRLIAQREVMQLNTIYKLNGLPRDVRVFKTRQTILTRKPRKNQ